MKIQKSLNDPPAKTGQLSELALAIDIDLPIFDGNIVYRVKQVDYSG